MTFQARTGCSDSTNAPERGNIFWSLFDKSSQIGEEIRVTENDLNSTVAETVQFSNTGNCILNAGCFKKVPYFQIF